MLSLYNVLHLKSCMPNDQNLIKNFAVLNFLSVSPRNVCNITVLLQLRRPTGLFCPPMIDCIMQRVVLSPDEPGIDTGKASHGMYTGR
jgi:hypothetical protein